MNRICLVSLLLSFPYWCNAQITDTSAFISYYAKIVNYLAQDELEGRACCSSGEQKAAEFIASEMKKANVKRVLYQSFRLQPKDSVTACKAKNIYAYIDNHQKQTILISAHYDHLGYGGSLSKSLGKSRIHPGADDNASGVAMMLGLMKNYSNWENDRFNYLFVAYSGHEVGLYGSDAFAKCVGKKHPNISWVINFDMVGRMTETERWLVVYGGKEKGLENIFPENGEYIRGRLEDSTRLFQLDTKPFAEKGIPCLSFTTGIHDDYHKVSDTPDKINYSGLYQIQKKIEQLLGNMPLGN